MAKKAETPIGEFYAKDRDEWRQWLAANHSTATGIWLIYYKKESGRPRVSYDEAVEEALCFGWVDSRPNAIDDEKFKQLFSPRKINKARVEKLIAEGRMTPAGLAKVEAAKQDGTWSALDEVEELKVPDDLQGALDANPTAKQYFDAFPPSSKKNILWWIESAKRPETRAKRVEETVSMAEKNLKANHYRQ
jgi:uncharacterized protein YdeI (YjbR/CyaY-like superfamily)